MTVIKFNIVPPIKLTATQSGLAVGPPGTQGEDGLSAYEVALDNGFVGTVQDWLDSLNVHYGAGERSSAVDAGYLGEKSLTDDYEYTCVQAGTAGNAIWKRAVLFKT